MWVVEGETGEYSTACTWPAAVFSDETLAQAWCEAANALFKQWFSQRPEGATIFTWTAELENRIRTSFDPQAIVRYDMSYRVIGPIPFDPPKPS